MNAFRGDSALSEIELEERLANKRLNRGMTSRLLPLVLPVRRLIAAACCAD